MKKTLILMILILDFLGGCGDEPPVRLYSGANSAYVTDSQVGIFLSSTRNSSGRGWVTTTEQGAFSMYTSTPFEPATPLTLEITRGEDGRVMYAILIDDRRWWFVNIIAE